MRYAVATLTLTGLMLAGCQDTQLETSGPVERLPDGGRIAVATPDGYRLTVQVEDSDGDVTDPVTVYLSDTGRRSQGRLRLSYLEIHTAGNTVLVQAQLTPDDLPEGEDFEDLEQGLLVVTDDLGELDDWAVTDDADPLAPVELADDGTEVSQRLEGRTYLVWRGGTFATERR